MVFAGAWLGLIFFPSLLNRILGGGARLRRPSRDRTLHQPMSTVNDKRERGNVPDDLRVNSAGNAVLEFQIHLWHDVLREDGGFGDITCRN